MTPLQLTALLWGGLLLLCGLVLAYLLVTAEVAEPCPVCGEPSPGGLCDPCLAAALIVRGEVG